MRFHIDKPRIAIEHDRGRKAGAGGEPQESHGFVSVAGIGEVAGDEDGGFGVVAEILRLCDLEHKLGLVLEGEEQTAEEGVEEWGKGEVAKTVGNGIGDGTLRDQAGPGSGIAVAVESVGIDGVGFDDGLVVAAGEVGVRDAGDDFGVEGDGTLVGGDGGIEEAAKAADLDEAGVGMGVVRKVMQPLEQAAKGIERRSGIGLESGVELMGTAEVGIEQEGAPVRGFAQGAVVLRIDLAFLQEARGPR